jgi:uncharacterized protein
VTEYSYLLVGSPLVSHLTTRSRTLRGLLFLFLGYAFLSAVTGIFVAESALHPARRKLPPEAESFGRAIAKASESDLEDVAVSTSDGAVLRAWSIRPRQSNGNAVILLHGMSDNRLGMTGYAQLLLGHGFTVLLPDARAHGSSGGTLATYGLLERLDIQAWFQRLLANDHPRCIFGLGESMGAAQLLQSLEIEPRFCGVVAESFFSTFREIAYDRMGQFVHAGPWVGRTVLRPVEEIALLYVRLKYGLDMKGASPEDSVARSGVPVFLIHGQIDHNIPVRHSRRIQALNPHIVLWEVPNTDHCGAIASVPKEFEEKLVGWFQMQPARVENLQDPQTTAGR